jgi:hypothetical protein
VRSIAFVSNKVISFDLMYILYTEHVGHVTGKTMFLGNELTRSANLQIFSLLFVFQYRPQLSSLYS